jgi:hypothetical protein
MKGKPMAPDHFDNTIDEIFQACCVQRQAHDGLSVLNMHPLTRAYFRTPDSEKAAGGVGC